MNEEERQDRIQAEILRRHPELYRDLTDDELAQGMSLSMDDLERMMELNK